MFPYKMNPIILDEKIVINNNNNNNTIATTTTTATTANSDVVQWPLNHSAYQNINTDNVDWAALAQQWIQLKTIPSLLDIPTMPVASQLPTTNIQQQYSKASFEEKGEAPMEVEKDDDESYNIDFCNSNSAIPDPKSSWNLLTNQPNWRKKTNITDPIIWTADQQPEQPWTASHHQQINFNQINNKQSLLPNPINFNDNDNQHHLLGVHLQSDNRHANVWATTTPPTPSISMNMNAHSNLISSLNANHNINNNLNVSSLNMKQQQQQRNIIPTNTSNEMELNQTIDAAKRKILPAWIREGLEKMEREKQKIADKAKDNTYTKLATKHSFDNNMKYEQNPVQIKSKFDSESDEENVKSVDKNENIFNLIKPKPIIVIKEKKKTNEQILEKLMKTVRTKLTEILLEVTNEELLIIASDTVNRKRLKVQTAQILPKTAITSLANKLGLGMYADSSDNSSEDNDDDDDDDADADDANENDNNGVSTNDTDTLDNKYETDSELKENIKRKIAAFEEKAKIIEAKLAIAEENERLWLEEDKTENSADIKDRLRITSKRESGEVQHEINTISNVRERKQSRFNNANDVKSSTPYETAINIMKKFDNANNMQLYSIKPSSSTTTTTTTATTTTTTITGAAITAASLPPPTTPLATSSSSVTASATITSAINIATNLLPHSNYNKNDDTSTSLKRLDSKTSSKYEDSDSSYASTHRRKSRSHSRDTNNSSYSSSRHHHHNHHHHHHKRKRRRDSRRRSSRSSSGDEHRRHHNDHHSSHQTRDRHSSSRSSVHRHSSPKRSTSRQTDEQRSYRKSRSKSRNRSKSSNRHSNNKNRSRSRSLSKDKRGSNRSSGGGGGSSSSDRHRGHSSRDDNKYRHRY